MVGLSLKTQEPRLHFCPKADLPLQTEEARFQFYKGEIGAVASCCFRIPLSSEQTLKHLKTSQGPQHGGEEIGIFAMSALDCEL